MTFKRHCEERSDEAISTVERRQRSRGQRARRDGAVFALAPTVQPAPPPRRVVTPGAPKHPVSPDDPTKPQFIPPQVEPPPPVVPPSQVVPPPPRPVPPGRGPQQPYFDWRRAARVALIAFAALLLGGGVFWTRCGIRGCPDVGRLAAYQPDGAPQVIDRYGREVGTLALINRKVVKIADLPQHVADAFIAVEDKRFREHHGIDFHRIGGALLANLRAGDIREGSSTITMQLARNVFPERIPGQDRTLGRKLLEARVAGSIERAYDKDEILELYLNHIYFGGGVRGIEAASQHYFRHPASTLSLTEAALLAALPKAPTRYDPRRNPDLARERRDLVLTLMEEQGKIDADTAATARKRSLGVTKRPRKLLLEDTFAGWFLEEVRRELEDRFGDGFYRERMRVITTLDARAQRAAERELDAQLARIERGTWGRFRGARYSTLLTGDEEGTDYLQGAVMFVEASTGDVLVWVGGRDFRHSRFDRVEQARRQVGSSFKPFVYASAIAAGIPPTQRFSDQPLEIRFTGGEVWKPRNFGDSYLPSVTMRDAIVQSRNVATVRLAESIGIDRIAELAEEMGLPRVPRQPSAALGASSATPLELTRAYTAFANLGNEVRPRFVLRVEDEEGEVLWRADDEPSSKQVLDPAVAYVVTDLLARRGAPRHRHGRRRHRRAHRGQDGHHQRAAGRLVRRLHARRRGHGVDRLRPAAHHRQRRQRRHPRGAGVGAHRTQHLLAPPPPRRLAGAGRRRPPLGRRDDRRSDRRRLPSRLGEDVSRGLPRRLRAARGLPDRRPQLVAARPGVVRLVALPDAGSDADAVPRAAHHGLRVGALRRGAGDAGPDALRAEPRGRGGRGDGATRRAAAAGRAVDGAAVAGRDGAATAAAATAAASATAAEASADAATGAAEPAAAGRGAERAAAGGRARRAAAGDGAHRAAARLRRHRSGVARLAAAQPRHCEERSDEAISISHHRDRFASLAMTRSISFRSTLEISDRRARRRFHVGRPTDRRR